MSRPKKPDDQNFFAHVEKTDGCWTWKASVFSNGYGQFRAVSPHDGSRISLAHRFSYEFHVGPIPSGKCIDHLCRNKLCVRPDHLEPVTSGENTRRCPVAPATLNAAKTHCARGHAFDAKNTRIDRKGRRTCRACMRAHALRHFREVVRPRRQAAMARAR